MLIFYEEDQDKPKSFTKYELLKSYDQVYKLFFELLAKAGIMFSCQATNFSKMLLNSLPATDSTGIGR